MNDKPITVTECKIQASMLLKALHGADMVTAQVAAQRCKKLPIFQQSSLAEIKVQAKRKHALAVIANENGYASWVELKTHLAPSQDETFVANYKGGFLNKWFATYESAKEEQRATGGFLLPYKHQYFICEAAYIAALGLDPSDPDWHAIDYDWVKPTSQKAWQRLNKRWQWIRDK